MRHDPADMVDGVPYGERRERFCGHFVESNGNAMRAFRLAFAVDASMTNSEVFKRSQALLADPQVSNRIREMQDVAAAATQADIIRLMQDWMDIASADPNEISAHMRVNCRFCWGVGHRFQWTTEREYCEALADAAKRDAPVPDISGGMGFNLYNDPNPRCPSCYGQGQGHVHIADTTKLVGPARKLYAGVKMNRHGEVEVLQHSQEKARENLARCLGAFKDAVQMPAAAAAANKPPEAPPSLETAQSTYMRVIQGGKS